MNAEIAIESTVVDACTGNVLAAYTHRAYISLGPRPFSWMAGHQFPEPASHSDEQDTAMFPST